MLTATRRKEPPTWQDVEECQWWWNYPESGDTPPHILQLDLGGMPNEIGHDSVYCISFGDDVLFIPSDWPGDWAPAFPPEYP